MLVLATEDVSPWVAVVGRTHVIIVVHFAVALTIVLAMIEFTRWVLHRDTSPSGTATTTLVLAFVAATTAAVTGWIHADADQVGGSLVDLHRWLGVSTAGVLAIAIVLSSLRRRRGEAWGPIYLLTVLTAAILVGVTGHFGGEMVRGRGWVVEPLLAGVPSPPSISTESVDEADSGGDTTEKASEVPPVDPPPVDPKSVEPVVEPDSTSNDQAVSEITPSDPPAVPATALAPPPPIPPVPTGLDDAVIDAGRKAIVARGGIAQPLGGDAPWLEVILTRVEPSADDDVLVLLTPLAPLIAHLNLAGTAVTDAGMSHVGGLPALRQCRLDRTHVTAAGVKSLLPAPYLTTLNLFGTDVDDGVIETLEKMPSLRHVFLARTSVTEEGIGRLTSARPEIGVYGPVHDGTQTPTPPSETPEQGGVENPPTTPETETVSDPKIAP